MTRRLESPTAGHGGLFRGQDGPVAEGQADRPPPESERDIWWGQGQCSARTSLFEINRERAKDYLNTRDRLYCVDGFAGWDPDHRVKVRVICSRPYHALFMHMMLIRPSREELGSFGGPDYVIYNAGQFPANRIRPA